MGRKCEVGIPYFRLSVDFLSDVKVRKLVKKQGGKAALVYVALLGNIYKNGYYSEWSDEMSFMLSEQLGLGYEEAYINEVVNACVSVGLFDARLFRKGILTSVAIQRMYAEICDRMRRKYRIEEFALKIISSEEKPISSEEKPISSEEMSTNSDFFRRNENKQRFLPKKCQQSAISSEEKTRGNKRKEARENNIAIYIDDDDDDNNNNINNNSIDIDNIIYMSENQNSETNSDAQLFPISELPQSGKTALKTLAGQSVKEREHNFGLALTPYIDKYGKEMIRQFFNYWTEQSRSDKMRFECEKFFDIGKRLARWQYNNANNFGRGGGSQSGQKGVSIKEAVTAVAESRIDITKMLNK